MFPSISIVNKKNCAQKLEGNFFSLNNASFETSGSLKAIIKYFIEEKTLGRFA